MSSTNRSDARSKTIADYYITPLQDIRDFLNAFLENNSHLFATPISILDPCAGGDTNNPMSYPTVLQEFDYTDITTNDIRDDSLATHHTDFLQAWNPPNTYDMIITNPPFNLALPIIEKALDIVKPGGYVIMLLRLNFFGSKVRYPFFQEHMPIECYIHHKRISFAKGATDSIEYAHFIFQKGINPPYTKTFII